MMLSLPSAFAAVTSASRPPQSATDVAVLGLQEAVPPPDVLPQAVTTTKAAMAMPRWRVRLANFMLWSPPNTARLLPNQLGTANHGSTRPMLQGHTSGVRLISVRRRLIPSGG